MGLRQNEEVVTDVFGRSGRFGLDDLMASIKQEFQDPILCSGLAS
jgi:hypothetical protein